MPVKADGAPGAGEQDAVDVSERVDTPLDPANPEIVADAPAAGADAKDAGDVVDAPPAKSSREKMALEIAERVKARRRAEAAPEFNGDLSDPTQRYGTVAQQQPDEQGADEGAAGVDTGSDDTAPAAARSARTLKLKVLGQDIELPEEEVVAQAQKALAGDAYLNDAKRKATEANEILEKAKRGASSRPDQGDRTAQDPPEPDPSDPQRSDQNDDGLEDVVDKLQFGTREEAAAELRKVLAKAKPAAMDPEQMEEVVLRGKMRDYATEATRKFKAFEADNPDLAKDKNARAVMATMLADGYREDLERIGVPKERIPEGLEQLEVFHAYYSVTGRDTRSPDQLLNSSKDRFVKWRGPAGGTQQQKTDPSQSRQQPRVVVDRTARREGIPTQPARAAAPQQAAPSDTRQDPPRSAAVRKLMVQRNAR